MSIDDFSKAVVLVIGGSGGIGGEIAIAFATRGASVIVNYAHSDVKVRNVVEEIEGLGGIVWPYKAAVQDGRAVSYMVKEIGGQFGKIDVLVNAAGVLRVGLLVSLIRHEWDEVIEVNLKGVLNCCRAVSKIMIRQKRGSIINVSSISAFRGMRGQSYYAASKGGVEALTRSLARELGPFGIRVNSIAPGLVRTEMVQQIPSDEVERYLNSAALGCLIEPVDIANAALFLASEMARYITGQTIIVDGGFLCNIGQS